jgi:hypothetical protein
MKKSPRLFLTAVLGFLAFAVSAFAGDPTGTWKWTFTAPGGGRTIDSTLKLELKDGQLSGTISGFRGETAISDASFKDDTVQFSVVRERDGQKRVSKYTGKVEGDSIKGNVEMPGRDGGEAHKMDWVATRAK